MRDYQELIKRFPEIFSHEEGSQEPFALFGFECDIGWYNLLEGACVALYSDYKNCKWRAEYYEKSLQYIDNYVAQQQNYYRGKNISDEAIKNKLNLDHKAAQDALEKAKQALPKVAQIKEKFGTLRFYIENGNETAFAIAGYAEHMSETTCEKCGNVGKTYTIGWHKTLCKEHAIKRYGEEAVNNHAKS